MRNSLKKNTEKGIICSISTGVSVVAAVFITNSIPGLSQDMKSETVTGIAMAVSGTIMAFLNLYKHMGR